MRVFSGFLLLLLPWFGPGCVTSQDSQTTGDESSSKAAHGEMSADAHHADHSPENVEGPHTWGDIEVMQFQRHFFAGQPTAETLNAAKDNDVEVVVNMREESEMNWDEKSAVEAAGMIYYHVPVASGKEFDVAAFDELEKIHEDHKGKVLVHCGNGGRAAAWFATHVVRAHGTPLETALKTGEKLGMPSGAIQDNVARFVEEHPKYN